MIDIFKAQNGRCLYEIFATLHEDDSLWLFISIDDWPIFSCCFLRHSQNRLCELSEYLLICLFGF